MTNSHFLFSADYRYNDNEPESVDEDVSDISEHYVPHYDCDVHKHKPITSQIKKTKNKCGSTDQILIFQQN